jgi:hypothetical protein
MGTSATERRIVLQPSRESNSEFGINAWARFKRRHKIKDVPRVRRIRDAHAITRRLIGESNSARWRDEQPKFAMDRGRWRNAEHGGCDNIAGSKHPQIGRLSRLLA